MFSLEEGSHTLSFLPVQNLESSGWLYYRSEWHKKGSFNREAHYKEGEGISDVDVPCGPATGLWT